MNDRHLKAVSISQTIHARCVRAPGFQARVLHAFPRALDLLILDPSGRSDAVIALVDPTVGDGPLNVVVSAATPFAGVSAGAMIRGDGRCLRVGGLAADLSDARVWDPRWPWERRSSQRSVVCSQKSVVSSQGTVAQWPAWPSGLCEGAARAARKASTDLRAALHADDRGRLAGAAASLAGLGPGLTPGGDDFLAGVMWGLRFYWSGARDVDALCDVIAAAAGSRTTPLSAALLRAAGAGLADARWHALFDALDRGKDATAALQAVLAQGATSGTDAWAGFQIPNSKLQTPIHQCTSLPVTSLPT